MQRSAAAPRRRSADKRACLVYNPAAGRGAAAGLESALDRVARLRGWEARVRVTRRAGDEVWLAREACEAGWPVVIAVGGDGTAHGVANGILAAGAADVQFGVVPVGSGNDFAKLLQLAPGPIEPNLTRVLAGGVRRFDVGRALDEYFINGLGIGFDAEVVRQLARIRRLRGFSLYLAAVCRTFVGFRAPFLDLHAAEHRENGELMMLEISIGTTVGGGFRITPDATPDDGLFDVCVIRKVGWLEFLRYVPRVIRGTHASCPPVRMFRSAAVRVSPQSPGVAVHMDGELRLPATDAIEVALVPRRLAVLCAP